MYRGAAVSKGQFETVDLKQAIRKQGDLIGGFDSDKKFFIRIKKVIDIRFWIAYILSCRVGNLIVLLYRVHTIKCYIDSA